MNRLGDWTETYTGIKFWVLDPRPEEISIVDIAHALSNICRFNGHCNQFYSVAQHSVLAAKEAERIGYDVLFQFAALMHDASEAYICDIPRPVKPNLSNYKDIENNVMKCVFDKFKINISYEDSRIKEIDNNLVCSEATYLIKSKGKEWSIPQTAEIKIEKFWSPQEAKDKFILTALEIKRQIVLNSFNLNCAAV